MIAVHLPAGLVTKSAVFGIFILIFSFFLQVSKAAAAETPQAVVKNGTDQVIQVLEQYRGNHQAMKEKIQSIVEQYFDFEEMARRAVGHNWKEQSLEKQQEFVRNFGQLLVNTYINDIERYTDEKFSYQPRQIQGDYAVVRSQVLGLGPPKTRIDLDYYLHLKGEQWKVYDVILEGVGLVSNYRGQFASILLKSSFDDLLRQLKGKVAES